MRPAVLRNLKIFVSVFVAVSVFATLPSYAQKHRYAPDVEQRIDIAGRMSKDGNFEEARRILNEALRLDGNCCECLNSLGITYFKEGRLKEAEGNFRGALRIDPLYLEALCNLGLCLYQQGESHYEEASVYFRQALELTHNNDFQLHKNLADVLRDKGDFKEALKHYGEAVRLQPDYAPAYNGLSMLYYRLKQYDKAYDEAQKAVKFRPDYALGYFYLGMIETARKHVPEAIQYYETSLKYEPNQRYAADTRQKISDLKAGFMPPSDNNGPSSASPGAVAPSSVIASLVRSQEWERAENELARLVATPSGKTANNYNNYGYVLSRRQNFDGAIAAYRKAIELKRGKFPEAHYNLGQVLRLNNQSKEAEKEIFTAVQEAQQMNKRFPAALNAYALMRKSRGDLKGAKYYYVRALTQAADTMPVIHYNFAILLEKTEQSRDAVAQYKRYLALAPAGKNAKAARERLKRLTGENK
ncbi:MAG TPA: tetratricopeptide repeat protein [Candidatus Melainabacteria bacterium]|jgi:tetratricopeptide (TPR) repeat protein|nr:tetratricopeptide repeat protein [Candidatus Melainabacteria bacterium]HIN64012.1 tetratricopeptide repeat protein [Candidatus Obscuribacterales bacterium]